jgi:NAD dependent epimerase/dehydratase family enzyme
MGEMSELLLCGQRVVPAAALAKGYRHQVPTLRRAMEALAQR